MIDRAHDLAVTRQAALVGLSRASVYYTPRPIAENDLALMRRIDELHLELPFAGSRMLRDLLNDEGVVVGREHVRTLMRRMGITAVYQRPGIIDLRIERPNREDQLICSSGIYWEIPIRDARLISSGRHVF